MIKRITNHFSGNTVDPEIQAAAEVLGITETPTKRQQWQIAGYVGKDAIVNVWELYGNAVRAGESVDMDVLMREQESLHKYFGRSDKHLSALNFGCGQIVKLMRKATNEGKEILPEFFENITDWATAQSWAERKVWM